jgi:histidinol-phosphate/aromatic aminotransferase/cobyric acid decarboxylase-like protein
VAKRNPGLAKWLLKAVYAGVALKVKNFLDKGVSNNWVSDTYNWSKEIVVVTGGSDGIGMKVVMLLAERGIKVVVLDIQPPKYTGTYSRCSIEAKSVKSNDYALQHLQTFTISTAISQTQTPSAQPAPK